MYVSICHNGIAFCTSVYVCVNVPVRGVCMGSAESRALGQAVLSFRKERGRLSNGNCHAHETDKQTDRQTDTDFIGKRARRRRRLLVLYNTNQNATAELANELQTPSWPTALHFPLSRHHSPRLSYSSLSLARSLSLSLARARALSPSSACVHTVVFSSTYLHLHRPLAFSPQLCLPTFCQLL